jgi:Tfp pilus assembly protein PilF
VGLRFPIFVVLLTFSTLGWAQVSTPAPWTETPERLRAWAKEAQTRDKNNSHILLHDVKIELDEAGRFHRRTHRIIEIRNDRDVERWSNLSVPWRKAYESRPEIHARVIRPDGEVRTLDSKTVVEAPAGEVGNGIYSDGIVLKVLPPGLAPGSVLEVSVQEHENKALFQSGRYDQFPLRSALPIDRMQMTLAWHPSQKLRMRWPDSLRLKKTEGKTPAGWPQVTLSGEQIDAEPMPEALSSLEESGSYLEISSAESWAQGAAEYQKIVEEQSRQSKKIPSLVNRLKKGKKTPADVIAAVTYYVQKEIRYTSLAFGEASVVPRTPDETLERAYGDCKDKATLAQAMLKEAGLNSRLALLQTAPHPQQSDDMPGLDRFNHVILAVQTGKDWTWIDLTAEFFKPGLLPPAVAGQKALLVGPEGNELRTIPVSKMEDNKLTITKTFKLARLGPAHMVRTETAQGIFDTFFRRSLSADSPDELMKEIELTVDPQAELESARASDPKDFGKPIRLEGRFQNVGTVDVWPAGTQVFAFPHQLFSGMPAALDPLNERDVRGKIAELKKQFENRQDPVRLTFPFQRDYVFQFDMPTNLEISDMPDPTRVELGPASFALKTRSCGPSCFELRYSFATGPSTIWSPSDVQDYAKGLGRVLDDKLYTISIKPKAFVLSEQGHLKEAVQFARKAAQGKDAQAADQLTLAQLMNRVGLIEESQQIARQVVQAQPQEKRIILHAAELFIRGENQRDCSKGSDCTEARRLYEQALKLDPSDRFALRTLPLLLVYNNKGIRYGRGADLQKADAAFAKAMKGSLVEDQEFFNTYLQHLTFTGQWIALDQALRRPPETMPPAVVQAWRVITLIGNQHPEEAKAELTQLLARDEGQASMQGLIKEMMQDRRYKEASQLFIMLGDRLPQYKGAADALAAMEPCPEEAKPDADLKTSLRFYICTMLSPDSTLKEGLEFVPAFAKQNADYQKYFADVEWDRRLASSRADPTLPPYFLIDSASTAYDVQQGQKLQEGQLIILQNTKVFAASPFAAEQPDAGFEPKLLAVQEQGSWKFIALDAPSVLSMLWFRAHESGNPKAAQDYAQLLGDLLDRSMNVKTDESKMGPEAQHYRNIVRHFRPLLKGNSSEQELVLALYAPDILNEKAVKIMDRELAKGGLKAEQAEIVEVLAAGRLVSMKKPQDAYKRLVARSEKGPFTYPMVQTLLELARSGDIKAEQFKPLLDKLEQSGGEERLSLLAEIKNLLGDREGAEKVFHQWLKKPSPNGLTENNFAWFYFTTGRTNQEALKLAQSATESAKESVANLNTLASIQAELGLTNEAIATQMQYRSLLGERDLGAADDLVTAINAEKLGLQDAALKRLKKIKVEPETSDLKPLLHAKIQQLEKGPKAR